MKMGTDPSKYCKDIEKYEAALEFATNELVRLMNDVGIGKVLQPLLSVVCAGLYGKELEDGEQ